MAMFGNLMVMLENVESALGSKMTIVKTLFADLKESTHSLGPIWHHTSKVHL